MSEEPTSESPSEPPADDTPPLTRRRQYRSRSERRTYRRAARKRRSRTRLWLVVGPALVVIAVIVVLLTLLGGPEGDDSAVTTLPTESADRSGLLIIEQDGSSPVMVLLFARRDGGGLALGMPGLTLLKTTNGFKTLAELHESDQDEALNGALAEAFGVRVGTMASVQWSELRGAMVSAEVDDVPPVTLTSEEGEAGQVASAVLSLVGGSGPGNAATMWEALPLGGDPSGFRAAASAFVTAIIAGEWTAAELTGRRVEGTGFEYLEPEVEETKALLAGTAEELPITLQVQNGSGVVGIAEQAGELLEPLGYTMLPAGNSEDFPDVEQTRITVSPDAAVEGERVRTLLGVGTIKKDETLETGRVVVVLGKDYVPPTTTDTGPGG